MHIVPSLVVFFSLPEYRNGILLLLNKLLFEVDTINAGYPIEDVIQCFVRSVKCINISIIIRLNACFVLELLLGHNKKLEIDFFGLVSIALSHSHSAGSVVPMVIGIFLLSVYVNAINGTLVFVVFNRIIGNFAAKSQTYK